MTYSEDTPHYVRGTFQQTCGFCGCVFHVGVPGQLGYEAPELYSCPECSKHFLVRASGAPAVRLISKRTDGGTDLCPNDKDLANRSGVRQSFGRREVGHPVPSKSRLLIS